MFSIGLMKIIGMVALWLRTLLLQAVKMMYVDFIQSDSQTNV